MKREEVFDKLATHRAELREMGVESVAVFGSVARDEAVDTSDVDLLITFNREIGLFHFARIRRRLSDILGSPVDLVTPQALRDEMREEVLSEAVYAE
ncbi:nucleotidyltransferase family protein [Candidatus Sumerlaeota bacterium]|nr:nucleotidyltransferase family protein [Candidatus Sumerlaeota bacterium]